MDINYVRRCNSARWNVEGALVNPNVTKPRRYAIQLSRREYHPGLADSTSEQFTELEDELTDTLWRYYAAEGYAKDIHSIQVNGFSPGLIADYTINLRNDSAVTGLQLQNALWSAQKHSDPLGLELGTTCWLDEPAEKNGRPPCRTTTGTVPVAAEPQDISGLVWPVAVALLTAAALIPLAALLPKAFAGAHLPGRGIYSPKNQLYIPKDKMYKGFDIGGKGGVQVRRYLPGREAGLHSEALGRFDKIKPQPQPPRHSYNPLNFRTEPPVPRHTYNPNPQPSAPPRPVRPPAPPPPRANGPVVPARAPKPAPAPPKAPPAPPKAPHVPKPHTYNPVGEPKPPPRRPKAPPRRPKAPPRRPKPPPRRPKPPPRRPKPPPRRPKPAPKAPPRRERLRTPPKAPPRRERLRTYNPRPYQPQQQPAPVPPPRTKVKVKIIPMPEPVPAPLTETLVHIVTLPKPPPMNTYNPVQYDPPKPIPNGNAPSVGATQSLPPPHTYNPLANEKRFPEWQDGGLSRPHSAPHTYNPMPNGFVPRSLQGSLSIDL
ncbi:extensin-like [Branchiostoma floridae]|uniref:Extensin-like n=1 Tax=Branchiostoma floridae TaxID=7739 RepID=A0A9J7KIW8_BRAFL|nr:extensin-like [Branchiostoma floridae]